MILFVGNQDKGYFVQDVAEKLKLKCEYIKENIHIQNQVKEIMNHSDACKYIVYDIEQYADDADEIVNWILKTQTAINCKSIIFAIGYNPGSEIISLLWKNGIRNFIFPNFLGKQKEDLELCINGYFENFGYESRGINFDETETEEKENEESDIKTATIGIAGAVNRMGCTTQALQFVKYINYSGYSAAYIEMNNHNFVKNVAESYKEAIHNKDLGMVQYQNVDMYYKTDKLQSVKKQGYDFFIYDYGVSSEHDFNKVSFLEKELQVFVVGSKPGEFDSTYEVIKNNFYNNVYYIFNFTADTERKDLIELMGELAENTFFSTDARDPFTYCGSDIYGKMLPLEVKDVKQKKSKGLFGKFRK